jgi:thiol-disulfide isomerase/thioredoxin
MRHGKFWDEYGDETRALWNEMGGTEEAWQAWRKQIGTSQLANEDFWTTPSQKLPEFALADTAGKSWQLKDLAGRTTLITVGATWCSPCRAKLPHVEKLYQTIKDRTDIQVVTFDVDDNPGLVQPFLSKHRYEFPVLLAYNFLNSMLDRAGIPQNWIVDPKGEWVSIEIGTSFENDWEGNVIRRLEAAHKSLEDSSGAVAAQK